MLANADGEPKASHGDAGNRKVFFQQSQTSLDFLLTGSSFFMTVKTVNGQRFSSQKASMPASAMRHMSFRSSLGSCRPSAMNCLCSLKATVSTSCGGSSMCPSAFW